MKNYTILFLGNTEEIWVILPLWWGKMVGTIVNDREGTIMCIREIIIIISKNV